MLELHANGAVIGRARSIDEDRRGWSSSAIDQSDSYRRHRTSHVASMATLPRMAINRECLVMDDIGRKPKALTASARSHYRSPDKHRLPVYREAEAWRQADDVSRRGRSETVEVRQVRQQGRRTSRDVREGRTRVADERRRPCKQVECNRECDGVTAKVSVVKTVIVDVDDEAGATHHHSGPTARKTDVTTPRTRDNTVTEHAAALRRIAGYKTAAASVDMSSQIWWPCQESSTDDEHSSTANDRAADSENLMSWTEIDASIQDSIRELDNFLQQQDFDPM